MHFDLLTVNELSNNKIKSITIKQNRSTNRIKMWRKKLRPLAYLGAHRLNDTESESVLEQNFDSGSESDND